MSWTNKYLFFILSWSSKDRDQLYLENTGFRGSLLSRTMAVSSHFSGVGTVEVAVSVMHANLPDFMAESASWTTSFVVDKARACVDILKARLENTDACIFSDVTHCVSDVRGVSTGNLIVEDVWKSLAGQRLRQQPCLKHGHACSAWGADADISGSPCQPFSRAGRRRRRNDPRVLGVLVWAHKMRDGTASQNFLLSLSVCLSVCQRMARCGGVDSGPSCLSD